MKSSQNVLSTQNSYQQPSKRPKNPVFDSKNLQQTEFTDKTICIETQTNLTPSKKDKSEVKLGPKQKLSQIVYNLKSGDFFMKYEKEKKESLRKEWMNMRKQQRRFVQNENQDKNSCKIKNFIQKSTKQVGKFNQFGKQTQQVTEISKSRPILQKRQQKRKRSKTQMLIYDYELEKIGTMELAHQLQEEYYNSKNLPVTTKPKNQPIQRTSNIAIKNKTVPIKQGENVFVKSEPKSKSYLEQVRQVTHLKFNSEQDSLPQRKSSLQSEKPFPKDEEIQKNCLSRPRNPISKSVMVQKIINLRKTFNDKYKKSPKKKSLIDGSIVQSSLGQSKQIPPPPTDSNSSLIIPYMSFPVMNLKVSRKLTFQELFQHEKKKMEMLKKYVNKGGVFNSFVQSSNQEKNQLEDLDQQYNLMNLSQLSNSNSFLMQENSSYLAYLSQSKKMKKPKVKWSQLQEEEIKTIKSKSKLSQQHILNISSMPIIDPNNSLQKDLLEPSTEDQQLSLPHHHVTTYEFDHMSRQLQRTEVKQLRHKYLYSSKRNFSKEECNQYGISMVSVHQGDQTTLRKWKLKCKTDYMMEECLEIEKKIPQNWDKMGKTSMNFIKTTYDRKKAASLEKQTPIATKQINKNTHNFEPWENHFTHQFSEQIHEFPD